MLKILPPEPINKLDNLKKHKIFNDNPDDLIHLDWSEEWKNGQEIRLTE